MIVIIYNIYHIPSHSMNHVHHLSYNLAMSHSSLPVTTFQHHNCANTTAKSSNCRTWSIKIDWQVHAFFGHRVCISSTISCCLWNVGCRIFEKIERLPSPGMIRQWSGNWSWNGDDVLLIVCGKNSLHPLPPHPFLSRYILKFNGSLWWCICVGRACNNIESHWRWSRQGLLIVW